MTLQLSSPVPTHRCNVCGAFWRFWPKRDTGMEYDSWSLTLSPSCGACCDSAPMETQIVPLTLKELLQYVAQHSGTMTILSIITPK